MAKIAVHYTRATARRFCEMLASWNGSATKLVSEHPELFPAYRTMQQWRDRYPVFAKNWKRAKEEQAEHLIQYCLDLATQATKENAHAIRVQFDIYKFFASKIVPHIYGDKPDSTAVTVNTQVVIGADQLNTLRANLERARANLEHRTATKEHTKERKQLFPASLKAFDKANPQNTKNRDSRLVDTVERSNQNTEHQPVLEDVNHSVNLHLVSEDSVPLTPIVPTSNGSETHD